MKRIFLVILVILLLLSGCGIKTEDIDKIEYNLLISSTMPKVSTDKEFIELIVNSINSGQKIEIDNYDSYSQNGFIINLVGNKEIKYIFNFNIDEKTILFTEVDSNKLYKVDDEYTHKLFLDDKFSDIYANKFVPNVALDINEVYIDTNISYNWFYKKIDDKFYSSSYTYNSNEQNIIIKQDDKISLNSHNKPDKLSIDVYHNGNYLFTSESLENVISSINKDGEYYFEIKIEWLLNDNKDYYGTETLSFSAFVDIPASVNISEENFPGNILTIYVENINNDETIEFNSSDVIVNVEVYPYSDGYIALMPISIWTKSGNYELDIIYNKDGENEKIETTSFEVKEWDFEVQYLTISEEISKETRNDNSYAEFAQYAKNGRSVSVDEKLWDGKFIIPVDGVLTTDYGEIRYVNNELQSSRHSGLDLAAPTGTDVAATNNGKVTLAKNLTLTGNTIIIDHGYGIFSSYYHLNSMDVENGDFVEKGQIIGQVGTTGFSTGPHLHFAISFYNTYVNTYQLLEGDILD